MKYLKIFLKFNDQFIFVNICQYNIIKERYQMQPQQKLELTQDKYSWENLQKNKKQMYRILKQSPILGAYKGQDPNQWHNFFKFYIDFLKSEIGPRGECSKSVRQQMSQKSQFYDQLLQILKATHKHHIKDIYVKYKLYSPCPQYDEYIKTNECLQKNEQSYKCIMDDNSIMYQKIKEGMLGKRGQDYDYKTQIEQIRTKYKEKIENLKMKIKQLKEKLENDENYVKYIKLRQGMNKFFKMWREADRKVGFQSIQKGDTFQKVVSTYLLPHILQKSKIPKDRVYKIQQNCRWYPKALGQIDISIVLFNEQLNKWEVSVLIQCKSRLFDIREAYKQVAVLKQKGKQKLCTSIGILDISANPQHFIVTTLPQNQFVLPIQSWLKQSLQKASKNIPTDEIKSENVWAYVKQVFKDELSPLEWFNQNNSDRILVLKY